MVRWVTPPHAGSYDANDRSRQHNAQRMTVNYYGSREGGRAPAPARPGPTRTRMLIVAIGAVLALAVGGAALALQRLDGVGITAAGHGIPKPTGGTGTAAGTPPAAAPTTAAAASPTGPAKRLDTSIVLPRNAAIDIDRPAPQAVANYPDGATGDYDFYHDWGQVKSDTIQVVNAPNVYSYSGGPTSRAYHTCVSDLTKSAYGSGSGDFCFRTSAGYVAFASVTRTREDYAFVVHVIVWDSTGS
jgi:hypothetical protein